MPRESELLDPLAKWFRDEYGYGRRILIHEEPQGRGGRRPDMLIVLAEPGREKDLEQGWGFVDGLALASWFEQRRLFR